MSSSSPRLRPPIHTLQVWLDVHDAARDALRSTGSLPLLRGRQLPFAALKTEYLYLRDAAVENSGAWRTYSEGAELDAAQTASHAALQELHLQSRRSGFAASETAEASLELYRNKLNAPVAASTTVAEMALVPLAFFCGIDVRYEGDRHGAGPSQPRLGPAAPTSAARPLLFGSGSADAAGLLDGARFCVGFGEEEHVQGHVLGENEVNAEADAALLRCSLSDIARQSETADASGKRRSASHWTLRLTLAELSKLQVAWERAAEHVVAADERQHSEDTGGFALASLRAKLPRLRGFDQPNSKLRSVLPGFTRDADCWGANACPFTGAHVRRCEATHIVARPVGTLIAGAHSALARPYRARAAVDLRRLGLLDRRLFECAPMADWPPESTGSPDNGFWLSADLYALYKSHAVVITPSARLLHITMPGADNVFPTVQLHGHTRSARERDIGWERAFADDLGAVKMRNVHLAYYATLLSVFAGEPLRRLIEDSLQQHLPPTPASKPSTADDRSNKRPRNEPREEMAHARRVRFQQQDADDEGHRSQQADDSYSDDDLDVSSSQTSMLDITQLNYCGFLHESGAKQAEMAEALDMSANELARVLWQLQEEQVQVQNEGVYRACMAVLAGHLLDLKLSREHG